MKAVNDILSSNGKGSRHSGQTEHFGDEKFEPEISSEEWDEAELLKK